jgi:F-type H+-transporting ATPase subunit delta
MNDSSISVRYAKAIFSLAEEKKVLEAVKTDMENLLSLSSSLPEFSLIIDSPIITSSDKLAFLTALIGKKANILTINLLNLLLTNSRENYLPMIARSFLSRYRENSGVKSAHISSAVELDASVVEQLKTLIAKKYNAKVDITCDVEADLLGGFVLQVDDQLIDASVANRLKLLKQELVKSK